MKLYTFIIKTMVCALILICALPMAAAPSWLAKSEPLPETTPWTDWYLDLPSSATAATEDAAETQALIEQLGGKAALAEAEKKNAQEPEPSEVVHRKSYTDYRAEQAQARSELPVRTRQGALTGEGHLQALEQRQARETAERVQNSMLANNSLPTDNNRDEWVRLFVNTYESPYVMSQLSLEEKEHYINILNEFFKRAQDDFDAEKATALYEKLSERLHDAIEPRLIPFIKSRMEQWDASLAQVQKQMEIEIQVAQQAEKRAQTNPNDAELRTYADQARAVLEATQQTGYSLATKIAGGAAIAALVTLGSAFVYAQVTGQTTGSVLSNLGASAANSWVGQTVNQKAKPLGLPRAGKVIGTAVGGAGSALGAITSATDSALKSSAQWVGNKAWNLGIGAVGTAAMNRAAGFLSSTTVPASSGIVDIAQAEQALGLGQY